MLMILTTLGTNTTRRMAVAVETIPPHTAMSSQWFPQSSKHHLYVMI